MPSIGKIPAAYSTGSSGQRISTLPTPGGGRLPGVPDVGRDIRNAGQAIAGALALSQEEEMKKRNFEAERRYKQMLGETNRQVMELQEVTPANGEGYTAGVGELWFKNYNDFSASLEPWQQPAFDSLAEGAKQELLTKAALFERQALGGHSLQEIERQRDEYGRQLLEDPSRRGEVEAALSTMIDAAPGLSPADRAQVAEDSERYLDQIYVNGRMFNGLKPRVIQPNSPEFMSLRDAVWMQEGSGRLDTPMGAAGEAGPMQVMPDTARIIAERMEDYSFPYGGTDEEIQEYLQGERGLQYGTFWLRVLLRKYGGDTEAALIAYNAGEGRADAWLDAGKDDEELRRLGVASAIDYRDSVMERMGGFSSSMATDPELNLSPDQRYQAMLRNREQSIAAGEAGAAQRQQQFGIALQRAASAVALNPDHYETHLQRMREAALEYGLNETEDALLMKQVATTLAAAAAGNDPDFALENLAFNSSVDAEVITKIRANVEDRLAKERAAAAKAEKEARTTAYETLAADVEEARVGYGDAEARLRDLANTYGGRGSPDYMKARNAIDSTFARQKAFESGARKLAQGDTYFSENELDAFSYTYARGIMDGDEQAERGMLQFWEATGQLGSEVKTALGAMLSSNDQRTVQRGLRILEQMAATRGDAWQAFASDEMKYTLDVVRAGRAQGMPEDEIFGMYRRMSNESYRRFYKEQVAARQKELVDGEETGMENFLDAAGLGGEFDAGRELEASVFLSRAHELYRQIGWLYASQEDAMAAVGARLSEEYGRHNGQVVYKPFSKVYMPIDGSTAYVDNIFRSEFSVMPGTEIYSETLMWNRDNQKAGGPPTHTVWYVPDHSAAIESIEAMEDPSGLDLLELERLRQEHGQRTPVYSWAPSPDQLEEARNGMFSDMVQRAEDAQRRQETGTDPLYDRRTLSLEVEDYQRALEEAETDVEREAYQRAIDERVERLRQLEEGPPGPPPPGLPPRDVFTPAIERRRRLYEQDNRTFRPR